MNKVLKDDQAAFKHKTISVLAMFAFCRVCKSRASLRKSASTRNALYFNKGLDRLNAEMDLTTIVKNVRILRQFIKIALDKDQQVLLQLKSTEFINSEPELEKSVAYLQE